MKVLIIGASGQLGNEFVKLFSNFPNIQLTKVDFDDLDITKFELTSHFVKKIKPELVINCSAFTDTVKAEIDFALNYTVNTFAPYNLAQLCEQINAKFVHFSTDYVFDGSKMLPYTEDDACKPLNEYGRAKFISEQIVIQNFPQALIFRLSWLYGLGNSNFIQKFLKWSQNEKEIKIVDDEISIPTSTKFVAEKVMASLNADLSGLFHLTPNGQCSRYDWAVSIKKILNIDIEIISAKSSDFEEPIKRPNYSVLSSQKLETFLSESFPNWEYVLSDYLLQEREYFKFPAI